MCIVSHQFLEEGMRCYSMCDNFVYEILAMIFYCIRNMIFYLFVHYFSKKVREKVKIGLNWKFSRRNQEVHLQSFEAKILLFSTKNGKYTNKYFRMFTRVYCSYSVMLVRWWEEGGRTPLMQ